MNLIIAEKQINTYLNTNWNVNGKSIQLSKFRWSFKGFDKAIKRLGVCYVGDKQIGLSKKMSELRSDDEVTQTMLHEIAHAIDTEIRGYSAHDHFWKNIARQIGYNGNTRTKLNNNVKYQIYNWFAICETHGILGGWTRKPKDNKFCGKCKSKVMILHKTDKRILIYNQKEF